MVREELYPMWMVSQVGKLILELETISCQKEQSPLHIRLLSNQIEKLSPLLQKLCGRSWSDLAAQSAFSALYGALEGTFRYLYTTWFCPFSWNFSDSIICGILRCKNGISLLIVRDWVNVLELNFLRTLTNILTVSYNSLQSAFPYSFVSTDALVADDALHCWKQSGR